MSGYARAYRSRWDHPLFKTKQEAAVWAWMTDTARFKAHSFQTKFGMVHLGRGQVLISERGIADDFGLHKNAVRRLLNTMVNENMIALDRDHGASRAGTIATIVNYEQYQSDGIPRGDQQDQGGTVSGTEAGPRPDHSGTTREEREKGKEGEEVRPSVLSSVPDNMADGKTDASSVIPFPSLPSVDHVATAFAEFEAMRREIFEGSRPVQLGADRRQKLGARLRDIGGIEEWRNVLAAIRGSPFLRGEGTRSGRPVATIDWLLKAENLRKVREGNYDERPTANAGRGASVRRGPIDALSIAIAAAGLG